MQLVIDKHIISEPIENILNEVKLEAPGKLKNIQIKGQNVRVTCPFHKNGAESHPSCDVYAGDSPDVEYGYYKCFTCGEQGPLWKLIAACLNKSPEFGKDWLLEKYGNNLLEEITIMPPIDLKINFQKPKYLDEKILGTFEKYHPYMEKRKLSKSICEKFQILYDPKDQAIVFPIRDVGSNLVGLSKRSVVIKRFELPALLNKPVYLLNEIIKDNITSVIICESQINALTCWSYGMPAVALFGTGTPYQYDILNKTSIRHYILMFDGDAAGRKGALRFLKNIRKDVIVDDIIMPKAKDVNDLTKDEFLSILYKFEIE